MMLLVRNSICGLMRLALILSIGTTLSSGALAERSFGSGDNYSVVGDETKGQESGWCQLTFGPFEGSGRTYVSLFFDVAAPDDVSITVSNTKWTAKKDERYNLRYYLGLTYWDRTSLGRVDGQRHGVVSVFPIKTFLRDFARAPYLAVYNMGAEGRVIDRLSLDGSAGATRRLEECVTWVSASAHRALGSPEIPENPFEG